MIDSLPMANSSSSLNWERSQWDSECERDIATNASRHLPCKFLSPSGVTPSMYALPCNDCSWGISKSTDENHVPSALDSSGQLLERPAPTAPSQSGQASRCSHARQLRLYG